jgi:hypothetical protein
MDMWRVLLYLRVPSKMGISYPAETQRLKKYTAPWSYVELKTNM